MLGQPLELLYDQLRDDAEITFRPVPKPPRDGRTMTARSYAEQLGLPTALDLPAYVPGGDSARPVRTVQTLHYPEELESILRHIAGAARLSIEETGVNMLYLILGFLEWYDSDDAERPLLAPLVLLPATLERGAPDPDTRTYRYVLRHSGEEIVGNVSLQERLRRDFSLALPDFTEETELAAYYQDVVPLLRGQRRWSIRRRATLGLVSFQKLLMYRDLDPRAWAPGTGPLHHPRVREFFEGVAADGFTVAPDYDLDADDLRSKVPPLIYDADSSQHSALVDALAGKNLVVQGPPGTGKSQTITNLIAGAIASGKTVLFVAEKLAALEVVKRRLDTAGLGGFCLELHSHKTKKREILDDVEARIARRFPDAAGLDDHVQQLDRQRATLNEYADTISRSLGSSGYSIYEALWACNRRRTRFAKDTATMEGVRVTRAATLTPGDLGDIRHALAMVATLFATIRTTWGTASRHPWAGVHAQVMTFEEERAILEATQQLVSAADTLIADRESMPLRLDAATSDALLAEAGAVAELRRPPTSFYSRLLAPLTTERPALLRFVEALETYQRAVADLSATVANSRSVTSTDVDAVSAAVERLRRSAVPRVTLAELRRDLTRLRDSLVAMDEARGVVDAFRHELNCELRFTVDALQAIEAGIELLQQAPVQALSLRHPGLSEAGAAAVAATAQAETARLNDQRARLGAMLHLSLAPNRDDVRRHLQVVAASGLFAMLRSDYRAARRAFLTMRSTEMPARRAVLRQVYTDLLAHADSMAAFESNAAYRRVAGPHFTATSTDFGALWAVAAWKERVDGEFASFGTAGEHLTAAIWRATPEQLKRTAALNLPKVAERVSQGLGGWSAFAGVTALNPSASLNELYRATHETVERSAADVATLDRHGVGAHMTVDELSEVATQLRDVLRLKEDIATSTAMQRLLGDEFAGPDTSVDALRETLAIHEAVVQSRLTPGIKSWLLDPAYGARLDWLIRWATEIQTHVEEFDRAAQTFEHATLVDIAEWFRDGIRSLQTAALELITGRGREALAAPQELQPWTQYTMIKRELSERGLVRLVAALEQDELQADINKASSAESVGSLRLR